MSKPRIIIADTDYNYIIPLQLRFVEEFFEMIDLEIITDPGYFKTLFSTPQKVDTLVVSEDLFDSSLQLHNIGSIFLMTEQPDSDGNVQRGINQIFKYTSIKEIFNAIIGKSSDTLSIEFSSKKNTQIIMVYSASGGVGKTTIALGLAAGLAQNYKRVLYINASWQHNFQIMLDNPAPISENGIYSIINKPGSDVYHRIRHVLRNEQFTYLPPFKASILSLGIDYSFFEKLALSAQESGDFDFVIVDADCGFNDANVSLLDKADKVIVVTRQDKISVYATNIFISNISGSGSDKYIFLCNNFDARNDNALISPDIATRFTANEYVNVIPLSDRYKVEKFSNNMDIKKIVFTIM